jgi:hypothetical protein
MYRVANNFMFNGVDIFKKVNLGMQAYTAYNYFDCSQFWGEVFDEVVHKSPTTRSARPTEVNTMSLLMPPSTSISRAETESPRDRSPSSNSSNSLRILARRESWV